MIILAIETSCDDTSVAVLESKNGNFKILSNIISSQTKIHTKYGGVVPNLAARAHLSNIKPCLKKAIKEAENSLRDSASSYLETQSLSRGIKNSIDLIAVTKGPGLIPSLLVGVNFAKGLSYNWNKPIIGINHIEAHLYANWLPSKKHRPKKTSKDASEQRRSASRHGVLRSRRSEQAPAAKILAGDFRKAKKPSFEVFPTLCLLVSGGHTQLILMKDHGDYKILGETRDDAAGEAFDKVAQMLNLGYPGGPIVSKEAEKYKKTQKTNLHKSQIKHNNQNTKHKQTTGNSISEIKFARPMINSKDYDFSFSGIKTSVLYKIRELKKITPKTKEKISYEFQQAVIDVLIKKTIKAAKEYKVNSIVLAGGVAANKELRSQLKQKINKETPNIKYYCPNLIYCTDNAAMVAVAAYFRKEETTNWNQIKADANLKLVD